MPTGTVSLLPAATLLKLAVGVNAAALWLQPVFDSLGQGQVNLVLMRSR